jgi:hypothetical protein
MFFLFWIRAYEGHVLKEICKWFACHHNFLEVLVDDEEVTLAELNNFCGGIFSGVRILERILPVTTNPTKEQEGIVEA